MARHDNKGRSKVTRHIRNDFWMLKTEAWRSLNPREIAIMLLLLEQYHGNNNGYISLSVREAAKLGHMAQNTASQAFQTLIERGFIKRRRVGSFSHKAKLASEYELTHFKYGNKLATKEFAKWKNENPVSIKVRRGIDLGAMSNANVL